MLALVSVVANTSSVVCTCFGLILIDFTFMSVCEGSAPGAVG